jgi:hypothetical protein
MGLAPVLCSSVDGEGIDELRRRIAGCARSSRRAAGAVEEPTDSGDLR